MRRTDLYEIKFQNLKYKKTFENTYRYHCLKKDVLKKNDANLSLFKYFFLLYFRDMRGAVV